MSQRPAAPSGGVQQGEANSENHDSEQRQLLTFSLGDEAFAIPIAHIREIIEFGGLTTIPLMPNFLRGVINLRGSVVPVIDLSARFGRGITEVGKRSCVVILELEQAQALQSLGVLVDSVSEVITVSPQQIEPCPTFGATIRADFIDGIINLEGRFVIALDVRQVVSIEEMAALISVAGGAEKLSESGES